MKIIKDIIKILIFLIGLTLLLSLASCNPVKKVLRDPEKFDIVVTEVIKRGYCVNDTTYVTKSDTLVTYDTVTNTIKETKIINDTAYIYDTKYRTITKKLIIRDTVKAVVLDNARIKLLQADSATLTHELIEYKGKAAERLNWLLFVVIAIVLYLFLKFKP